MEELNKAIKLAMSKFKGDYGELEDGDEFVTVFNNGVLIISYNEGEVNMHFIGGQPYTIDETVGILESEG